MICSRCKTNEAITRTLFCESCLEDSKREQEEVFQKSYKEMMLLSGVSIRHIECDLADFKLPYEGNSALIIGPAGCGKTSYAIAMLKEDLKNGKKVLFTSPNKIFRDLRKSYENGYIGSTESQILDSLISIDNLYLDDIGYEKLTDWGISILYAIINDRYDSMKRTIITSNLSVKELSNMVGDGLASRIAGIGEVIKMQGSDKRINKK